MEPTLPRVHFQRTHFRGGMALKALVQGLDGFGKLSSEYV